MSTSQEGRHKEKEQESNNHEEEGMEKMVTPLEGIKEIVEEGINARNVLSWRVPNEPSPQGKSRAMDKEERSEKKKKKKLSRDSLHVSSYRHPSRIYRMNALNYETASDTQSEDSRTHFQSRLWRFLFSNITRAVDELYNLCEDENNRDYCIEGIKMFESCKNDFAKLIERMDDQKKFEEGDQAGGVSWEVRKSNSGKRRVLSSSKMMSQPSPMPSPLAVDSSSNDGGGVLHTPPSSPLLPPNHKALSETTSKLPSDQSTVERDKQPLVSSGAEASNTKDDSASKIKNINATKMRPTAKPFVPSENKSGSLKDNHLKESMANKASVDSSANLKPDIIAATLSEKKTATIQRAKPAENHRHSGNDTERSKADVRSGGSDDPLDEEVQLETEKVWAQAEAWLEAEMKAEEDAWTLMENASNGYSSSLLKIDEIGKSDSFFELSTDEDMSTVSEPKLSPRSPHQKPPRQDTVDVPYITIPPSSPHVELSAPLSSGPMPNSRQVDATCSPTSQFSSLVGFDDSSTVDESVSTKAPRSLHEKLSSPERCKRNRWTPEEARLRHEERQVVAQHNRGKTVAEKKLRAQVASSRVKAREHREAQRIAQEKESFAEKLKNAGKRHNDHIKSIRGKAGNENTKVSEVAFINSLTEQNFDDELRKKLLDTEARIMAGRRRREEHLDNITVQQRKRNSKKAQQMSENRLNMEKQKMERWEKLQARLEAVRHRKEERLAEMKRRSASESHMEESPSGTPVLKDKRRDEDTLDCVNELKAQDGASSQADAPVNSVKADEMELLDAIIAENKNVSKFSTSAGLGSRTELTVFANTCSDDVDSLNQLTMDRYFVLAKNELADKHRNDYLSLLENQIDLDSVINRLSPSMDTINSTALRSLLAALQSALGSAKKSSKRTKRRNKRKNTKTREDAFENDTGSDTKPAVPQDRCLSSLDVSKVLASVAQCLDEVNLTAVRDFIREGGADIISGLLDDKYGIMNAALFDCSNIGSQGLKRLISIMYCASNAQSLRCNSSLVWEFSVPEVNELSSEQQIEFDTNNCNIMMENGLALRLVSLLHACLINVSIVVDRALQSSSSSTPSNRSSTTPRKYSNSSLSGTSGSKLFQEWSPRGRPSSFSKSADLTDDELVPWPKHTWDVIFPLMDIIAALSLHISSEDKRTETDQMSELSLHWFEYITSSGVVDSLVALLRQLQSMAGQCSRDRVLFDFLCSICRFLAIFLHSTRCLRIHSEGQEANGLTTSMRLFQVPEESSTGKTTSKHLHELVVRDLRTQELSSHAVGLLGSLLLQDTSRASSRGRQEGASRISSGFHAISSDVPILLAPIVVVCHDILLFLNKLCCFDLETAQNLAQDLKASSSLIAEQLLLGIFPMIEKTRRGEHLAPTAAKPKTRRGKNKKHECKDLGSEVLLFPDPLPRLEVQYLEDVIKQLLVYLGYLNLKCVDNQSFAVVGPPPSMLVRLCSFPIIYFSDERLKRQLLPSIISCCYRNDHNLSTVCREMSVTILVDFLKKALLEKEHLDTQTLIASCDPDLKKGKSSIPDVDPDSLLFLKDLSLRFPVEFWEDALSFFNKS